MSLEQSESIYQNALLADAAYIHFEAIDYNSSGVISALDETKEKFIERGVTDKQFEDFRAEYRIVDHKPNEFSGLSMTIFEHRQTGQRTLVKKVSDLFSE